MKRTWFLLSFRLLLLVAAATTSALLYDYTRPMPAFCEAGAGCETVRQSLYSHVAGIPQPVVGLLGLAAMFAASFLNEPRRKFITAALSVLGALASVAFLAIQAFVLHTFCHLCVVVDVVLILLAALALGRFLTHHTPEEGRLGRGAWIALALLSTTAPFFFGFVRPAPPVPPGIARLWVPGKLTVVEMSDFECPFCRVLHPRLSQVLDPHKQQIHFVRMPVPLPSHRHARHATKAYFCAKAQGQGEQMADALFHAEDMSPEGCNTIASALTPPLDLPRFQACLNHPNTEALVTEEEKRARAIGFRGLPTTWIGTQSLLGAQPIDKIRDTVAHELHATSSLRLSIPVWTLWLCLGLILTAAGLYNLKPKTSA